MMDNKNLTVEKKPVMFRVARTKRETPDHVTLFFNGNIQFRPGQFVMLWIPGLDEKPYTISYHGPEAFGITVEAKGRFSKKAALMKQGDLLGIRGPFGNGFNTSPMDRVCVVAGGCGTAPVAPLIDMLGNDITLIQGARSKDLLLFRDRYPSLNGQYCTDDGSFGHKGFVTELLEQAISRNPFNMVYACGPEIMMKRVFDICEKQNIPCQVSLERYMRCGFGACGACVCGAERVCIDGPVFNSKKLRQMDDFNQRALLKSGAEVPLSTYASWRCGEKIA